MILSLIVSSAGLFSHSAAFADVPQPTEYETQIIRLFDAALKGPDPLGALSKLPWRSETTIFGLSELLNLKNCQLYSVYKHRGLIATSWAGSTTFPNCGQSGDDFNAYFEFKDKGIALIQVNQDQVIAASGGGR